MIPEQLKDLMDGVREARVPAMVGVTAEVLDEHPLEAYAIAVEAVTEYLLAHLEIASLVEVSVKLGHALANRDASTRGSAMWIMSERLAAHYRTQIEDLSVKLYKDDRA